MSRYRTIVADPPWDYGRDAARWHLSAGRRPEIPYQAMTVEEIAALPIDRIAAGDSRLFLWTTNRHVEDAFGLVRGWGFVYRQMLIWHKTNASRVGGSVAPNTAEFLIVATRGDPAVLGRAGDSVISIPKTAHSAKPEAFLDLVERVSPGPYAELFARRARFGWDYPVGDQALGGIAA
jgi:N6-adenosine-specific RNA methylase IME4